MRCTWSVESSSGCPGTRAVHTRKSPEKGFEADEGTGVSGIQREGKNLGCSDWRKEGSDGILCM